MALREQLLAVAAELRRRKAEGEKTISIGDDTLAELRRVVESHRGGAIAEGGLRTADLPAAFAPSAPARPFAEPPAAVPEAKTEARIEKPENRSPKLETRTSGASMPESKIENPKSAISPPAFELPAGDKSTRWNWLRDFVINHSVCQAHVRPGKKVVLGVGSVDARIFFCGEAPGAEEEIQGEPFVGAAGQLLTKMIKGMGLERSQVYIGNIMNWRPEIATPAGLEQTGNRPPTAEEMAFCLPFLKAQLAIVQPAVIVALGATAAAGLLGAGTFKALGEIRGRWHAFAGVPLMVTYHPSYLLRDQSIRKKRIVWEDLLQVMEKANLPINDKQRGYFLEK